jgi:hypothetical protein
VIPVPCTIISLEIDGSFAALILFLRNLHSMYSSNNFVELQHHHFRFRSPLFSLV